MSDHESSSDAIRLSDDVAHRLLARAIELDERRLTETSLPDLRELAREAGISAEAFEQAFAELRPMLRGPSSLGSPDARHAGDAHGFARRLWQRLTGVAETRDATHSTNIWESVATNTLAFAAFWVILGLVNRIFNSVAAPWEMEHLAQIPVYVLGVGIALRLRAAFVAFGLAGMAIAEIAKYVMHLMFGIDSVQGGPTQLAVIIAGVLGVTIGGLIATRNARSGAPGDEERRAQAAIVPEPGPAEEPRTRRLLSLRARPA